MQQRHSTNQSICTIRSISKLQLSGKYLPLSLPSWLQGCAHLPHLESQLHPGAQPHLTNLLHWATPWHWPSKHCSFQPGGPPVPVHGQFSPDFPTLSAPMTRTFASIFRAVGPGTSIRAGWSGVKLVLRRRGSRSPMPSVAEPLGQPQPCVNCARHGRQPGASHGTQGTRQAHTPPRSRRGGAEGTAGSRMKNFVIAQIVLDIRQRRSRPCQPPARRAAGRTSCRHQLLRKAHHPGRCPGQHRKDFVPPRGHAAPCPFPTAMVGMSARSGGVSQVLGCLASDEAADEGCESPVTDGASHGRWNFVSPGTEQPAINGARPRTGPGTSRGTLGSDGASHE